MSEPSAAPPPTPEPTVRVNLKLRDATHHRLRLWCLKNRYTLQDGLEQIVEAAMGHPPIG